METNIFPTQTNQDRVLLISRSDRRVQMQTEAAAQLQMITDFRDSYMKPGVHFGIIKGKDKTNIFKGGVEMLMQLFGLVARFEATKDIVDVASSFRHISFKCVLTQKGEFFAEGVGEANSCESRCRSNPLGSGNWIMKMAKKRALSDAVLTGTGASSLFTCDLEDFSDEDIAEMNQKADGKSISGSGSRPYSVPKSGGSSRTSSTSSPSSSAPSSGSNQGGNDRPSDAQVNYVVRLIKSNAKQNGIEIFSSLNESTLRAKSKKEISGIIDHLKKIDEDRLLEADTPPPVYEDAVAGGALDYLYK